MTKKITVNSLQDMKQKGEKIASLTAYDATFAKLLDVANVDVILVGDSLGMVLQGGETTLKVTISDMIYHIRMVKQGCKRAMLIGDMPFMSYATPAQALGNAARFVAEGGAEVIKLEGGSMFIDTIKYIVDHGIPICGHLGLTPQSIHKLGGYRVQGRDKSDAEQIFSDAKMLEDAGVSILVLECVPHQLAEKITEALTIPVIGIGAGSQCDGQVLVLHDMLGLTDPSPKFSKNFLEQAASIKGAIQAYVDAVKEKKFPAKEHQFD